MQDQERLEADSLSGQVLVVDDHELVRELIVEVLQSSGLEVVSADSGPAALSIINDCKDNISCIVQDMSMPGMSGPETISETLKVFPEAQIIVLSVDDERSVRHELGTETIAGYLQKPCDTEVLVSTVKMIVSKN